jgi:hypothetical protein
MFKETHLLSLQARIALMTEWAVYCAKVPTVAVVRPIRGAE